MIAARMNRRALLAGAVLALPAVTLTSPSHSALASPNDILALRWAEKRDVFRALADAPGPEAPDRVDRLMRISNGYDDRIWAAPCSSVVVAQVKLESLAKAAEDELDPQTARQLRHIAQALGLVRAH